MMTNEIALEYEGGLRGNVEWADGGSLTINAPAQYGGCGDASPSPKDLFAAGYASCIAMTMEMAGKRGGIDISGAKLKVSAVWAEDEPLLSQVNATVVLPEQLDENQLDVLREGAHNCPIHNSLRAEVQTTLAFEVA